MSTKADIRLAQLCRNKMNIKPGKCMKDPSLAFALEVDVGKSQCLMGLGYLVILSTVSTTRTYDISVNKPKYKYKLGTIVETDPCELCI